MGDTVDKALEAAGLKDKIPDSEPETYWFFNLSKPDGDGYLVPNGKWKSDGSPDGMVKVSKKTFNIMVWKMNIDILSKRIAQYQSVIDIYSAENKRLENIERTGTSQAGADMKEREMQISRIARMWEHYHLKYRNKSHTPAAKQYKAGIMALQAAIPKKSDLEEHHQITDRFVEYDLAQIEANANRAASNQPLVAVNPKIVPWTGDVKDLQEKYDDKIDEIEKKINPLLKRKSLNENWLKSA